MPRTSVQRTLTDFVAQVERSNQLLDSAAARGVPFFQLENIAELCFLRIYCAWENFLEEAFSRFLCGAITLSGGRPKRYVLPLDIDHAQNIVVGLERGRKYADWARRETVTERAKLFLKDGRPFVQPLQAAARELDDMRAIRDCIAHRSAYANKQFRSVVQRRLGVAHKYHAGRFLLRRTIAAPAKTHLVFFSESITAVAAQIVG